jgi:hypothetical protein
MSKNLTDISIRNLRPGAARREIRDGGARGLYLVVQPSGVKTFAVRYRLNGKPQKLTLGRWQEPVDRQRADEAAEPKIGETLSLASARKLAADTLLQTGRGRDPGAAKRRAKQEQRLAAGNTLEAIAEEYLKRECGMKRNAEGRPTFASGKLRSGPWRCAILERLVYPTLGDYPITEIKRSDVIRLLDRIEAGELKDKDSAPIRGGSTMADRTLAIIRKILNWHATRSDDFRSPIVRGMARVKPKLRPAATRPPTWSEPRLPPRPNPGKERHGSCQRPATRPRSTSSDLSAMPPWTRSRRRPSLRTANSSSAPTARIPSAASAGSKGISTTPAA